MTNEEILKKALEKANKNRSKEDIENTIYFILDYDTGLYDVIFSKDFAKAFWGEEQNTHECYDYDACCLKGLPNWQYHLTQMVQEDDPIKYLAKFLD